MVSLEELHQYVEVLAGIAEIIIVFLLWKTVLDFSQTAKVSRIQSDYRFRPWVGPSTGIQFMQTNNGVSQYSITLKNFAEIPASKVIVRYAMKNNEMPRKEMVLQSSRGAGIQNDSTIGDEIEKFDLAPYYHKWRSATGFLLNRIKLIKLSKAPKPYLLFFILTMNLQVAEGDTAW